LETIIYSEISGYERAFAEIASSLMPSCLWTPCIYWGGM